MKCDDVRREIDALVDGELDPDREAAVRDHLSACEGCAREAADRRSLSAVLKGAFDRAFADAEPAPEERPRIAAALAAPARPRIPFAARVAAVLVIGLAGGLLASLLLAPGPDRERVAMRMAELERRDRQLRAFQAGLEEDLGFVESVAAEDPPFRAAKLAALNVEDRLTVPARAEVRELVERTSADAFETRGAARAALRRLDPSSLDELRKAASTAPRYDRAFVTLLVRDLEARAREGKHPKVAIETESLKFTQRGDGICLLVTPEKTYRARSMEELRRKHPEVCRKFGIAGRDGRVTVAGQGVSVDLKERFDLVFRTRAWDEDLPFDAARAWLQLRVKDAGELEKRMKELRGRWGRRAAELPAVKVDVQAIVRRAEALGAREIEKAEERIEKELQELDARLRELRELRARARNLRSFVEELREGK